MKLIDLVEVTEEELGGQVPAAGAACVVRGQRYVVLHATPPQAPERRDRRAARGTWKLLVRRDANDAPACQAADGAP
jgi:hypothetical protein